MNQEKYFPLIYLNMIIFLKTHYHLSILTIVNIEHLRCFLQRKDLVTHATGGKRTWHHIYIHIYLYIYIYSYIYILVYWYNLIYIISIFSNVHRLSMKPRQPSPLFRKTRPVEGALRTGHQGAERDGAEAQLLLKEAAQMVTAAWWEDSCCFSYYR